MQTAHSHRFRDMGGKMRTLEICVGDITKTAPSEMVDLLAISCFLNDYIAMPGTLVAQLKKRHIDVGELAQRKARDWRQSWQAWISAPLSPPAQFGRIVCFEHGADVEPDAVVGNVFRAISEHALELPYGDIDSLRVPLLSTGDQGASKEVMLDAIISQAYTHLRGCLPVKKVQIVIHDQTDKLHALLVNAGISIEQAKAEWVASQLPQEPEFDFFISYRRTDAEFIGRMLSRLKERCPSTRVFIDEKDLKPGSYWKPELIKNLYNSRRTICYITDEYVNSIECVDEFHAALCCSRSRDDFLRPLLNLSSRTLDSLCPSFRRLNLIHSRCPPCNLNEVVEKVLIPTP